MKTRAKRRHEPAPQHDWDPRRNQAVMDLLDHLAQELAEEYVRLMKQALQEEDRHESGDLCPVQFGEPAP